MTQTGPTETIKQFYQAIQEGNLERFISLLNKKAVHSELIKEPHKALEEAAKVGAVEMMSALLDVTVVGSAFKKDPSAVFLYSAKAGSAACVKAVLEFEEVKNKVKKYSRTALYFSIESGNADVLELLLSQKGVTLDTSTARHLLLRACGAGNLRMVNAILKTNEGELALKESADSFIEKAINSGSVEVVQRLLEIKEVRAEFEEKLEYTLEYIEVGENEDVFAYLLKIQAVKDYFYLKPSTEKQELLGKIIKAFPGTQAQTLSSQIVENLTGLGKAQEDFKEAFKKGSLKKIDALLSSLEAAGLERYLERGALLENAFKHSSETKKSEIVARILKVEGMIEHVKENLNDTLFLAAKSGGGKLVEVLLGQKEIGAAINANPHNTLIRAIDNGSDVLLKSLLTLKEVRAELEKTDPSSIIIPMFMGSNPEIVRILLREERIETALLRGISRTMRLAGYSESREVINAFLEDERIQAMIRESPLSALEGMVSDGNIELFNALLEIEEVTMCLPQCSVRLFMLAIEHDNVGLVGELLKRKEVKAALSENPIGALKTAAKKSHVGLLNALFEVEEVQMALKIAPFQTIKFVKKNTKKKVLTCLLKKEAVQHAFYVEARSSDIKWLDALCEKHDGKLNAVSKEIKAKLVRVRETRKELSKAFKRGDVKKLGDLLAPLADGDIIQYLAAGRRRSLLVEAISDTPKLNSVKMVKRLLQVEAIQAQLKKDPDTVILQAVSHGNLVLVNVLREVKEIEAALKANPGRVLNAAIQSGNLELVIALLHINEVKEALKKEPARMLERAAQTGSVEVVTVLREVKEVEASLKGNPSHVLEAAISSGSIELVNVLFRSKHMGTTLKAHPKQTLEFVKKKMNKEMLACLLGKEPVQHAFYMAADKEDRKFLQRLKKHDFDPLKNLEIEIEGNLTRLEKLQDALMKAFSKGDMKEVESIFALAVRSDLDQYLARDDNALLKGAIKLAKDPNGIKIVKHLLQEEVVKAQLKKEPLDVLVKAAHSGSLELVNVLRQFKAVDAELRENPARVLEAALLSGNVELVSDLRRLKEVQAALRENPIDVFMMAVQSSNFAMFESILRVKEVHAALGEADPRRIIDLAGFIDDAKILALMLEIKSVNHALSVETSPSAREFLSEIKKKFAGTRTEEIAKEIEANHAFIDETIKKLGIAINQGNLEEIDVLMKAIKESGVDAALARNNNALLIHAIAHAPEDVRAQVVKRLLDNISIRQAEGVESSAAYRAGQQFARSRADKALVNVIQETVSELEMASAGEGAMRGLTPKQAILFRVLELRYGHKVDKKRTTAAWKEMQTAIKEKYQNSPIRFRAKGKMTKKLPLGWSKKELSVAELALYYKDEWHTAYRYFLKPNPWMSKNARYVAGMPKDGTGYASVSEADRMLFAMLWEAVNDDTLEVPFMEGATPKEIAEVRANHRETFLREFSGLNRAHNWDKYKTRDDGEGDQPTCDRGVTQRMASFLQRRMALPILTKQDIEGRFVNAFIEPVIDKMSLAEVNRLIKWVEFYSYIEDEPIESAEEKRKSHLDFFTIPEKERDAFKMQCAEIYKASSGSDNALKAPQTVRVSGVVDAKLANYDAFVDLLSEDPEKTLKYFMSEINDRLKLRKGGLEKQVAPSKKAGLSK